MFEDVTKTIKLFTAGGFNRSESGKTARVQGHDNPTVLEVSVASRKDVRDMVRAAAAANSGWAETSPYLRGQILYRTAEMLSSRKAEFEELAGQFVEFNVSECLDSLITYAGWSDKIGLVFGAVPSVPGYHVTTSPEPLGPSVFWAGDSMGSVVTAVGSCLAVGSSCIVLTTPELAPAAISFGEVLKSSDVPPSVVQIAACTEKTALQAASGATEVRFLNVTEHPDRVELEVLASESLTRCASSPLSEDDREFKAVRQLLDYKTTWTPLGK